MESHQRWLLGIAAGTTFIFAVVFRFLPWVDEAAAAWTFNSLTKVAILLLTASLAWPNLNRLWQSSYGRLIVASLIVIGTVFIVRPRAIFAFLPLIIAGVSILVTLTFLKDLFSNKTKR